MKSNSLFVILLVGLNCLMISACSATLDKEALQLSNDVLNEGNSATSLSQKGSLNEANDEMLLDYSNLIIENSKLQSDIDILKSENSKLNAENSKYRMQEASVTLVEASKAEEAAKIKDLTIGETVSGKNTEYTISKVSLSYKVKPDNPPKYYRYYEAKDGKVYIKVDGYLKNKSKESVECNKIISIIADYNDGYTYTGFQVVDAYDGDFDTSFYTRVDPLETLGTHYLIDCPDEVATNTSAPLYLLITLDNEVQYRYKYR